MWTSGARRRASRAGKCCLWRAWALAQAWYGDRMAPDFHGWTVAQATDIFARLGLTSAFWQATDPP